MYAALKTSSHQNVTWIMLKLIDNIKFDFK